MTNLNFIERYVNWRQKYYELRKNWPSSIKKSLNFKRILIKNNRLIYEIIFKKKTSFLQEFSVYILFTMLPLSAILYFIVIVLIDSNFHVNYSEIFS